jgi:hypothetical protein
VQLIKVFCDMVTRTLCIDPPSLDLHPDSDLQWTFLGVPNDAILTLQFLDLTPTSPFSGLPSPPRYGPFQTLSQTPYRIIGQGRVAGSGPYEYRLLVSRLVRGDDHPGKEHVLSSGLGVLQRHSSSPEPLKNVVTVYQDGSGLKVMPETGQVCSYETMIWEFPDLADGYYPRIRFLEGPYDLIDLALGPFRSITYAGKRVIALGNNEVRGRYRYLIEVVDCHEHRVRSYHDPILANLGDPPGGD